MRMRVFIGLHCQHRQLQTSLAAIRGPLRSACSSKNST